LKFDKHEFKAFLNKRYPPSIVDIFLSYFGITLLVEYKEYVEMMEMFMNLPIEDHK